MTISSRSILLIGILFLISSCTTSQKQGETPEIPVIKYSSGKSIEASSLNEKKKKDIQSFQDAMNAPNFEVCENETTQDKKDQCKDGVISTKAAMSKDATICKTIKNEVTLGRCLVSSMKIASGSELKNPCIELVTEEAKTSCEGAFITMQATIKDDQLLCNAIKNETKKHSCIMNVVITEVIRKKDISLCTKIVDSEGQKNCFSIQFGDTKIK